MPRQKEENIVNYVDEAQQLEEDVDGVECGTSFRGLGIFEAPLTTFRHVYVV
jgi:hypothetical protein